MNTLKDNSFVGLKTMPDKNLTVPSKEVTVFNDKLCEVAEIMYDTMVPNGIGLAAPQVGINLAILTLNTQIERVLIAGELMDCRIKIGDKDMYFICNPKIEFIGSRDFIMRGLEDGEGCLSVPPKGKKTFNGQVLRYKNIRLTYNNIKGEENSVELSGYASVVIQHEFDHIAGKLFVSRMHNKVKKMVLLNEYATTFGVSMNTLADFMVHSEQNKDEYIKSLDELIQRAKDYGANNNEINGMIGVINYIES